MFKDLISINRLTPKLQTSDGWEEIFGHMVTGNYFDLLSFGIAAGAVSLTIVLASWLPARRATKVNPIETLRYE